MAVMPLPSTASSTPVKGVHVFSTFADDAVVGEPGGSGTAAGAEDDAEEGSRSRGTVADPATGTSASDPLPEPVLTTTGARRAPPVI
ncbi:hypothetical protein AQJ27_42170 [Streptomyces olivochromogenes]|nr:hypothetical protein AQJ27_42170 [Streptomyces olivochromogenes]